MSTPKKSPGHKDFEFMDTRGFAQASAPRPAPAPPIRLPAPRRGRPPRGAWAEPVQVKAVKLPPAVWRVLEAKARANGLTLHAAMRAALWAWAGLA